MDLRPYDSQRDLEAIRRIWAETGWIDPSSKTDLDAMDYTIASSRGWVALIDGEAECLVLCSSGQMRYLEEDLSHSIVAAVTTSHVGRRQGFASRLTAMAMAEEAADGALLSGLGMFEQGYYDRLGFGSGNYEHFVRLDPQKLTVPNASRPPKRLTIDDWEMVHAARLKRKKAHGYVSFDSAFRTRHDMLEQNRGFGLGFYESGELTHHFWAFPREPEHGPYAVWWLAYQNNEQLIELLGTLKNLGDQVRLIEMVEPPGIQLQDLVEAPLLTRMVRRRSHFEVETVSFAHWQIRICDIPGCLGLTKLRCDELRFNLHLSDPIEAHLDDDAPWKGVGGDYIVTLGASSGAERGTAKDLPTLKASVNAFTRAWLGIRPASGLAVTDTLSGPPELIEALDWAFCLPEVKRDWMF